MKNNIKKMVALLDQSIQEEKEYLKTIKINKERREHLIFYIRGLQAARDILLNNSTL